MQFGMLDTVFNALILLFWFKMWADEDREFFFNPYLLTLRRFSDPATDALRVISFGAPPRFNAFIALAFLIVLRAVFALYIPEPWQVHLGFQGSALTRPDIIEALVFSGLSFGVFLFKLWGVSLIYLRARSIAQPLRTTQALQALSRPFSRIPGLLRPWVLLLFGSALVVLFARGPTTPLQEAPSLLGFLSPNALLRIGLSVLAAWTDVLLIVQSSMVLLIIGSWVSSFAGSGGLMAFCRDWLDMLLGPFRRFRLAIGMFDLTPILAFFVIQGVYSLLRWILLQSLMNLP